MSESGYAIRGSSDDIRIGDWLSSALFVIIILYFWIGISPFQSLGDPAQSVHLVGSNILNQFTMMTISLSLIVVLLQHPAGHLVTKLWGLLLVIFLWLVITGLLSIQPLFVLRRTHFTSTSK